jgi:hypothetical protein
MKRLKRKFLMHTHSETTDRCDTTSFKPFARPFEGKKLLYLARHTAEVEIRPSYSSLPLVPKNCDLKKLSDRCSLKKEDIT